MTRDGSPFDCATCTSRDMEARNCGNHLRRCGNSHRRCGNGHRRCGNSRRRAWFC